MADIIGKFYSSRVIRRGVSPSNPGNIDGEEPVPVNPPSSGSGIPHEPVTIGTPSNGLSITAGQVLSLGLASSGVTGALSGTDWNTFNGKLNLTSPITGYTPGANTALAATDTLLGAFGKIQGQINARISGTIDSGQVAFGTASGVIGGDSGLTWDNVNKRLAVGINVPLSTFHLSGDSDSLFIDRYGVNGVGASIIFRKSGGTSSIPSAVTASSILGLVGSRGYNGSSFTSLNSGIFLIRASQDWNTTSNGSQLEFYTTPNGSTTSLLRLFLSNNGYLGINNNNPVSRFTLSGAGANDGEIRIDSSVNSGSFGLLRFTGDVSTFQKFIIAYNSGHPIQPNEISIKNEAGAISFYSGSGGSSSLRAIITSSGLFGIAITTPTNTLDVNGTTRIRTISNLGSTATRFLVASATGVISERTGAELVSDLGISGGSNWTLVGSDIYRDSAVAIGRTTIPTNATFAVQSKTATATAKYLQFLNNSGTELFSQTQDGRVQITGVLSVGTTPVSNITGLFRSQTNTNASVGLRVQNQSGTTLFTVDGNSVSSFPNSILGVLDTPISNFGLTVKSQSAGGGILWLVNSTGTSVFDIINDGTIRSSVGAYFGNKAAPTGRVNIRGTGTTTGNTLLLEDSAGNDTFAFLDNGNLSIPSTNGAIIATTTSQKFAFWGKTPIVQPTTAIAEATFVENAGGTAVNVDSTFGGYTLQQIAQALINVGLLA